jgi:hypothetical protein
MAGQRLQQLRNTALYSELTAPYRDLLVPTGGAPIRTGSAPLKGAERAETQARVRTAYEAGATVREVAQEIGRSYSATYKLLVEAGAAFRSPSRRQATRAT